MTYIAPAASGCEPSLVASGCGSSLAASGCGHAFIQAHEVRPAPSRDVFPAGLTRRTLIEDMQACEQTRGLSVLDHGEMVWQHFLMLLDALASGCSFDGWRIPDWASDPVLRDRLFDLDVIREYQVFHDCGKPYCVTVDEEGRRHFPDHAAISERVWQAVGGSPVAARLMGMDMDIHLLKADGVPEFAGRPEAPTLLLTGLAEVHANAGMFGGFDSVSFKSKVKQIDRRGRQIVKLLKGA